MEINAKFNVGDVLSSVGNKYIGKVIKIKVNVEKVQDPGVETHIKVEVVYTIRGNESNYDVGEESLYCIEKAKKLEIVKE